jgi:hypothetical protein
MIIDDILFRGTAKCIIDILEERLSSHGVATEDLASYIFNIISFTFAMAIKAIVQDNPDTHTEKELINKAIVSLTNNVQQFMHNKDMH